LGILDPVGFARSVMKQTHCPLIIAPQATARPGKHRELAEQAMT
jgi:hypothetical protein